MTGPASMFHCVGGTTAGEPGTEHDNCFVYLIACRNEAQVFVKIGRSRSLRRRLSNLQTGCPHPISDVFVISSRYGEEIDGLERLLHRLLKKDRLRGEWYEGTSRFFRNLDGVLSRVNAGGFSYEEICALPDMNAGPELEIMMHRHDFVFRRLSSAGGGAYPDDSSSENVDASVVASLMRQA